jgi:alpha-L-fucosidase 2
MNRREFIQGTLAGGILSGSRIRASSSEQREELLKLWYGRPAGSWVEALPVGNGRLGAMMFGGIGRERLQLNEDTLWSGGPADWNNPEALEVLPRVRQLIREGDFVEADRMTKRMMGPYTQSYLSMGDLWIQFDHGDVARNYHRELDLNQAVAAVRYRIGEAEYRRELFVSHPAQGLVLSLSCSQPGGLSFRVWLDSPLRFETISEDADLLLLGEAPSHVDPSYTDGSRPVRYDGQGMRFCARLKAVARDGSVEAFSDHIRVRDASGVDLLLTAATSFSGFRSPPGRSASSARRVAFETMHGLSRRSNLEMRQEHVADYRALFERVELKLGGEAPSPLATDRRIAEGDASDPHLVELLFQFGRYLLISSSRPGTQPANLQGIWNHHVRPPWSSNWTLNINAQMNYWPAETTALAELHEPLFDLISELAENGRETARINYGARGWVAHHNTDIWRQTAPVGDWGQGDPVWAMWPMAAPWLCQHLWEHYLFNPDLRFLSERAYPLMKGAAEFCLDWLIEDERGRLTTSPSTSPELKFISPEGAAAVNAGATMDLSLIWELFTSCMEASEILGVDRDFRNELDRARNRLHPLQIGSRGQLQEWSEDWPEEDPQHRHFSHLFGLHPGRQITPEATPLFFEAAKRSLELRGDGGTGWSLAWKINAWARLRDGDRAARLLSNLLRPAGGPGTGGERGGVYPNLLDAHPPFQIDGNFGATAGIVEMLAQSHDGRIHLLPALPSAWPDGSVRGLRARGGVELEISWSARRLTSARLSGAPHQTVLVRLADRTKEFTFSEAGSIDLSGDDF